MKKPLLFSAIGLVTAFGAQAQEAGRVISSTPVIEQVAVPRQVCSAQPVAVPQHQGPGAGAAIGAVAGGLLGNTIGHGGGRAAATVLGVLGGAVVGDRVEGRNAYAPGYAQHCTIQTTYENRTVAYNVSYEYAGRTYTAQMPQDPGATVWLQVSPMAAQGQAQGDTQLPRVTQAQPLAREYVEPVTAGTEPQQAGIPILRSYEGVPQQAHAAPGYPADGPHYPLGDPAPVTYGTTWAQPAPIYYTAPVLPVYPAYGAYGYRPFYPPIGISLNLGYSRGFGHSHRGHRGHRGHGGRR